MIKWTIQKNEKLKHTNLKTPNYIFIVSMFFAFNFISCKNDPPMTIDYNGKEILAIHSDSILLNDGLSILLNSDSLSKVFYLVRHAEKDTLIKDNPPLTEAGLLRATKLADILKGTRVDAIYTTMTLRTMYTADSIADIKAMNLIPYDNKSLKDVINNVKSNDELNRILMVGHQNTIPAITNTLAEKEVFNSIFADDDYGNFVIVFLYKTGSTEVYKLRY